MKDGKVVLALLRSKPEIACAAWGFICRGTKLGKPTGGPCALTCEADDTVYKITPIDGAGDFFIPYGAGEARYCDVPKNQKDGTLVVTFPMNGCALEVHPIQGGNRFFHDADGKNMPKMKTSAKCRVDYAMQAGPGERAAQIFSRYDSSRLSDTWTLMGQNFEHTVLCVKAGKVWNVYQTAVVSTIDMKTQKVSHWQIKDGPPVHVGVFAD